MMKLSRREMLKTSLASAAALTFADFLQAEGAAKNVYKVGAWINGLSAFDAAKEIGLDVLQVSFPLRPSGGENDFRNPDACKKYLDKSAETGVAITSLAMGEFNELPFWKIDDAEERVTECIEAMKRLGVKTVLISYFGEATLDSDDRFEETIRRYKNLAPKAEDAGVVLAIESTLGAEGHLRILEGVDSPSVGVYYDPGNMIHRFGETDAICDDIRKLKGFIAEAHIKDSGLLGKGRIDYAKVLDTYREVGYFGPQVIEGSNDENLGGEESCRRNAAYIRSL